jgi:hypothetical protein
MYAARSIGLLRALAAAPIAARRVRCVAGIPAARLVPSVAGTPAARVVPSVAEIRAASLAVIVVTRNIRDAAQRGKIFVAPIAVRRANASVGTSVARAVTRSATASVAAVEDVTAAETAAPRRITCAGESAVRGLVHVVTVGAVTWISTAIRPSMFAAPQFVVRRAAEQVSAAWTQPVEHARAVLRASNLVASLGNLRVVQVMPNVAKTASVARQTHVAVSKGGFRDVSRTRIRAAQSGSTDPSASIGWIQLNKPQNLMTSDENEGGAEGHAPLSCAIGHSRACGSE